MAIGTGAAERSVLQWATPDGNCFKGGQGRRGNHRNLSGETASQRGGAWRISPLTAKWKGRVWLAQQMQRGIAEIELELRLAM